MGSNSIAGIESFSRFDYYSEDNTQSIVSRHHEIAENFGVINPYYKFTDKGEDFLVQQQMPDGIMLYMGRIGAFTKEQIARSMNEQIAAYVLGKTMGPEYPNDQVSNEELTAVMIGGMDEQRLVVLFDHSGPDGVAPVAGVQAYLGNSETTLINAFLGNGELDLTIATLQSLQTTKKGLQSSAFQHFLDLYGNMTESQVVCMSRLFKRGNKLLQEMGIKYTDQSWDAMAALIVGIQILADDQNMNMPQALIYDTHNEHIQDNLSDLFGMKVLLTSDMFVARPSVTNNVLKYHYGGEGVGKSLFPEILVGYATDGDYLAGAVRYMMGKYGIDVTQWIEDYKNRNSMKLDIPVRMTNQVSSEL